MRSICAQNTRALLQFGAGVSSRQSTGINSAYGVSIRRRVVALCDQEISVKMRIQETYKAYKTQKWLCQNAFYPIGYAVLAII